MQNKKVQEVYNAYFRFNNKRTLSTDLPSELSITHSDSCSVFVDKTRKYDNQIVIHDICNLKNLEALLKRYHNDYPPHIHVEPLANSHELCTWLSSHGFVQIYQHEFLQLPSSNYVALQNSSESITIERWGQSNVDNFLALLKTSGLECPDDIWLKKRSLYCTDIFRCYIAKINNQACAWATSFIEGEYAILANAYTQESYRSRGCQTALLNARAEDAINLGVKVLLTDVIPESTSSKNCHSVGFSSVGIRSVWGKSDTP